jgi:DNA-binding protein YbaB
VGLIADTYDSMRAVGRSADRSVTVTLGGRGGVDVTLADDVLHTHTEEQLARQVAGAARLALAAYQHEQKVAIDDAVEQAQAPW